MWQCCNSAARSDQRRLALRAVRVHSAGMNLSHLRAGLIGTGFIGPVHLEALKRLGVQITAVCGSTKSATALAEKWGVPEIYGDYDYEGLLKSPNVDVVHITSPNKLHVVQALAAIKGRKARRL